MDDQRSPARTSSDTSSASAPLDSMIRSGRQSLKSFWLRIFVSVVVSGFLFVFQTPLIAAIWLATILSAEVASAMLVGRIAETSSPWRLANVALVWVMSAIWVIFGLLLWASGDEIARIAAIVSLMTVAVYGVTNAYMNGWILIAMVGPQLATLAALLLSIAWTYQPPVPATVTTLATLGTCLILALNGATLHRTDKRLLESNAHLVELNARISELARQADRRSEARTELLANVSHELRTPLNGVIAGLAQFRQTPLNNEQTTLLGVVRSSSEMLDRLAGDLLDLSAIESGKISLKPSPLDLGVLVESIAEQQRHAAQDKGLKLEVTVDPSAKVRVLLDPVRLQQVIGNLLTNAIKYTEQGNVSVRARHRTETANGLTWAEIVVEDTGPGFGETDAETLFERFQRGDDDRSLQPGLGLGLTIARTLTEAMGGQLRAESRTIGSAFIVELPMASADKVMPSDAEDRTSEQAASGLRILVADDHAANRELLKIILHSLGASVALVDDGSAAVSLFQTDRFDIVLIDMMMPGKDGLAATREMRRAEAGRNGRTPIILLTASHSPDLESKRIEAGCDDLLTKPIVTARLVETIARLAAQPRITGGT